MQLKLEDRIKAWIKDNPDRAYAGNRMLNQLERVRTEFTGQDAVRLEALVAETLDRQLGIDVSRIQNLEDSTKLARTIQSLKDNLKSGKEKSTQGIEAAAHKIDDIVTRSLRQNKAKEPNKDLSFVPEIPKVIDKSLN